MKLLFNGYTMGLTIFLAANLSGSLFVGFLALFFYVAIATIIVGGKDTQANQIKNMDVNSKEYLSRYMPK